MDSCKLNVVYGLTRFARLAACLTVLAACIALLGWSFDIPRFRTVGTGLAPMKINTAVGLACCGIALLLLLPRLTHSSRSIDGSSRGLPDVQLSLARRAIAMVLASVALLIGLLTLIQYAFGIDLGIDELLGSAQASPFGRYPGRISPATSACLVLAGGALNLIAALPTTPDGGDKPQSLAAWVWQTAVLLMFMIALLGLFGYAFGVDALYSNWAYASVAIHTSIALCVLALGICAARPWLGPARLISSATTGGMMARRVLPATVGVPVLIGVLELAGQRAGLYEPEFGLAMFALSSIAILAAIVWWNARLIERSDRERRRLESERLDLLERERAARRNAETAVLARDQLLSLVSHELRTPLTPVVMLLSALIRKPDLNENVRSDLRDISDQIDVEVRLIDDLLDMVRLDQGKLLLRRESVDVATVVRKLASSLAAAVQDKQLSLNIDTPADLLYADADKGRFQQILQNLLENAIKFTSPGGTIDVRVAESEGHCLIEVIDTGIGIDADALERIFDPFEQADASTTRRFGGLGIGLSIARRLTMLHGGTLEAHSEGSGRGATFRVRLPAAAASVDPMMIPPGYGLATDARVLKLLLVEDNEPTLRALDRMLRAQGHDVTTAFNADDAMEKARDQQFDLLISDIGLPDLSGWDLLRELRKQQPIPAIALSGFVSDADRKQSQEAGFTTHLGKPVEMTRLIEAISNATSDKPSPTAA